MPILIPGIWNATKREDSREHSPAPAGHVRYLGIRHGPLESFIINLGMTA